ncbi:TadE/TadG family type IV pilus assembly protein [Actinophytocola sp. KF-1]
MPTPETTTHRSASPHRGEWWRGDDGSATTELALVTPFLITLLTLVGIVIHRGVDARIRIDDAAHQAARAASLERAPAAATTAAQHTASNALAAAGVACRHHEVTTTGLEPGDTISVTVTCDVDVGDALIPGLVATQRVTATATEPVDLWRSAHTGRQP